MSNLFAIYLLFIWTTAGKNISDTECISWIVALKSHSLWMR